MKKRILRVVFCVVLLLLIITGAFFSGRIVLRHERRQNSDIEQLQTDIWSREEATKNESKEFRTLQQKTEEEIRGLFSDINLNAFQKLSCGKNIRLLIVGDSIGAQQWTNDVAQWIQENYQVECKVTNISLGGNDSYAGFVSEKLMHDEDKYDLIIVCYGQNDKVDGFNLDYEALIRGTILKNQTNCIIPVLESSQREYNEKMQWIMTVAEYYQLPVADTIKAFNNSGYSYELLSADGVHPNDLGQNLYSEVIESVISEEVKEEYARRNSFIFDNLKEGKAFLPESYAYCYKIPEPIDKSVICYEQFRFIPSDEFVRLNETEWACNLDNISGILGISWARCPQTNQFEIFLNDKSIFSHDDYLSIDYVLKKIDRLHSDPFEYNGKLRIVFATEEGADQFTGIIFTDYKEL